MPKRSRRPSKRPRSAAAPKGPLQYKVVELSTVDEASLEETLNAHVGQGWNFDGVHFAIRESSKRPSMAFVFFTRPGGPASKRRAEAAPPERLRPVAAETAERTDPWVRLAQLAEDGEDDR